MVEKRPGPAGIQDGPDRESGQSQRTDDQPLTETPEGKQEGEGGGMPQSSAVTRQFSPQAATDGQPQHLKPPATRYFFSQMGRPPSRQERQK